MNSFLYPERVIKDICSEYYFEKSIKITDRNINTDRYIIGLNLPSLKRKIGNILSKNGETSESYFRNCFVTALSKISAHREIVAHALSCLDTNEFYISSDCRHSKVYYRVYFGSKKTGFRYEWSADNPDEYTSRKYKRTILGKNTILGIVKDDVCFKNIVYRWLNLFCEDGNIFVVYTGEREHHEHDVYRKAVSLGHSIGLVLKLSDVSGLIEDTFCYFRIDDTSFLKDRHLINSTLRWIQFGYESDGSCFFTIYYLAK
jgi:hypothetical protein